MKRTCLLISLFFLIGCAAVPITGRRQLSFIPEGELMTLSAENYKQVLTESKLSTDAASTAKVVQVGKKVAAAAEAFMKENGMEKELAAYRWEFNLIDDPKTINAFCMPGGKIVVYTGILPVVKDVNGLATVMSHEVAHALANHGGERMSQQLLLQYGGMGLSELIKSKPDQAKKIMAQVYGAGAQYGVLMPFGRGQETEADHIGLILMARAGYDPKEAIPFWQRMGALGGLGQPEFLSTHPSNARRIADITKALPEAQKYYKK